MIKTNLEVNKENVQMIAEILRKVMNEVYKVTYNDNLSDDSYNNLRYTIKNTTGSNFGRSVIVYEEDNKGSTFKLIEAVSSSVYGSGDMCIKRDILFDKKMDNISKNVPEISEIQEYINYDTILSIIIYSNPYTSELNLLNMWIEFLYN